MAYAGSPLYTTNVSLLPDYGIQSTPLISTAALQELSYQSVPVSFGGSTVISSEPVLYQGDTLMYATAALGPTAAAVAAQPMGNLPQPSPPANWTLSKCNTSVQQSAGACLYTYVYEFVPSIPGKSNTVPDTSNITSPNVPADWLVSEESCVVKRVGDAKMLYKYELSYYEKGGKPIKAKGDDSKDPPTAPEPADKGKGAKGKGKAGAAAK
jgi:hypothetical protein